MSENLSPSGGVSGGFRRLMTSFLSMVRFVSVVSPFYSGVCGVLSFGLTPMDLFFSLSTSLSSHGTSKFQTNPSICFSFKF